MIEGKLLIDAGSAYGRAISKYVERFNEPDFTGSAPNGESSYGNSVTYEPIGRILGNEMYGRKWWEAGWVYRENWGQKPAEIFNKAAHCVHERQKGCQATYIILYSSSGKLGSLSFSLFSLSRSFCLSLRLRTGCVKIALQVNHSAHCFHARLFVFFLCFCVSFDSHCTDRLW